MGIKSELIFPIDLNGENSNSKTEFICKWHGNSRHGNHTSIFPVNTFHRFNIDKTHKINDLQFGSWK